MAEYKKAKGAVEDLHWDSSGTGSTSQTPTSTGGFREVRKINASHIPLSSVTRALHTADNATDLGDDVDTALANLTGDVNALGVPDDSTIENSSGSLQVKDGGITPAKLSANAIDTDNIAADAITESKIEDSAVTESKIAVGAVTGGSSAPIAQDTITNYNIATNAIAGGAAAATGDDCIEDGSISEVKNEYPNVLQIIAQGTSAIDGSVSVSGVTGSDLVFIQPKTTGCVVDYAITGTDTIHVELTGAGTYYYIVLRPI